MLYGIRKIEYCNAANLAFSDIFSTFVPTCTPTNEFVELCFVQGKATLKIESSVENKQPLYNAELQFDTLNIPALERGNYAFKVTTVDGQQMLIGSPTRPRVVVTTAQNVAESAGGANGYTTKCSFKAIYTPKTIPNTDEPASDTREFDICCGAIKQGEPISGAKYDVCCGEITGIVEEPINMRNKLIELTHNLTLPDEQTPNINIRLLLLTFDENYIPIIESPSSFAEGTKIRLSYTVQFYRIIGYIQYKLERDSQDRPVWVAMPRVISTDFIQTINWDESLTNDRRISQIYENGKSIGIYMNQRLPPFDNPTMTRNVNILTNEGFTEQQIASWYTI